MRFLWTNKGHALITYIRKTHRATIFMVSSFVIVALAIGLAPVILALTNSKYLEKQHTGVYAEDVYMPKYVHDSQLLTLDYTLEESQAEEKRAKTQTIQAQVEKNVKKQTSEQKIKAEKNAHLKKFSPKQREYLLRVRPKKIQALKRFFAAYRSPLINYVEDFVYASEYYQIDYRLLPAISIVESSGGKRLFKPYNPFGWGKWGYKSFKHAIWDVSRGMSVYYYRLNLRTPEAIGRKYNPVTPKEWASKVRWLMNKMPKY